MSWFVLSKNSALSSVKESFHRVGTRFYRVQRFIAMYPFHALVAWAHRVQRDESLDGIKCGPYPVGVSMIFDSVQPPGGPNLV
jgi:hypothetical protein